MSETPLRLAIIVGSNRHGRFGATVGRWFTGRAAAHEGVQPDVIDLAALDVPGVLGAAPPPEAAGPLAEATTTLERADAFVVITPEYNHSFPGALKNFIDLHYTQWQAKPVALVSYGGLAGGQRAAEHLRQVFAELHAVTIRDTVALVNAWERFDDEGRHRESQEADAAAKGMLDRLTWWGHALRDARAVRPYAA
ncbi:NAD(P)H-dependent oxidoreductase [Actinomadura viridis]|uniref:NAD(P)H-dependent FMN reductase n=1 Tax=Actinomadura viridis TaxID=58110 RepID=A0A931GQW7_9ACTN|nr:NAD(P)H-dependent oxidoreductase [Actinomadura viridis]MBG6092196.1 NAD(P)H-dependent FMN reductase [Actinomadura viridis]